MLSKVDDEYHRLNDKLILSAQQIKREIGVKHKSVYDKWTGEDRTYEGGKPINETFSDEA